MRRDSRKLRRSHLSFSGIETVGPASVLIPMLPPPIVSDIPAQVEAQPPSTPVNLKANQIYITNVAYASPYELRSTTEPSGSFKNSIPMTPLPSTPLSVTQGMALFESTNQVEGSESLPVPITLHASSSAGGASSYYSGGSNSSQPLAPSSGASTSEAEPNSNEPATGAVAQGDSSSTHAATDLSGGTGGNVAVSLPDKQPKHTTDNRSTWNESKYGKVLGGNNAQPIHLHTISSVSIASTIPLASEATLVPGEFTVTRTGDVSQALLVDFETSGTAQAGTDFVIPSSTGATGYVVIPAGSTSATTQVMPLGNRQLGGPVKTVVATLDGSTSYRVSGDDSAVVSITTEPFVSGNYRSRPSSKSIVVLTSLQTFNSMNSNSVTYYTGYNDFGFSQLLPISTSAIEKPAHGEVTSSVATNDIYAQGYDSNGNYVTYLAYRGVITSLNYSPDADFVEGSDPWSFTQSQTRQDGSIAKIRTVIPEFFFDPIAPAIVNPGDQSSVAGDDIDFQLTATDPDNHVLTYSATGLPPGMNVDPVNGDIVGHADYGDQANGSYPVTVTVTNGNLSGSQSFLWNVTPAAPSIDNADDPQWNEMYNGEGDNVYFPVAASDSDQLPLMYTASGLPPGVSIDSQLGIISGTIAAGDDTGAPYDVTVSVSNGATTTTLEFLWSVTHFSFVAPTDQTNVPGDTVDFSVSANDYSNLPLSFSSIGLPDGLSIDTSTGVISGVVTSLDESSKPWQVSILVTDGTQTAEHTFYWSILPGDAGVYPSFSLVNPGNQTNFLSDVISLQVQANASASDTLQYAVTGLPNGLGIDPCTGIITGMDDDFNALDGTIYTVTVSAVDDYGLTASQTFTWQFNSVVEGMNGIGVKRHGGEQRNESMANNGVSPSGPNPPGQHPTSEIRTDNFDVDAFWENVEKLPDGLKAEEWFLANGKVEWAWLGITTVGRFEKQSDGTFAPVVYTPQRYNEADAAIAFVNNITQSWVTGFAAEANIPTDQDPASMQTYLKARAAAMGSVVTTGAELYLSGLSIANEGADFIITMNDIATADTLGEAAISAISILPFVSSGSIKLVKNGATLLNFRFSKKIG